MERSEILEMLTTLQLASMRASYDEIFSIGIKRQHGIERVIGALCEAARQIDPFRRRTLTPALRPKTLLQQCLM